MGRQKAAQAKFIPLGFGKSRASVEERIAQQRQAARRVDGLRIGSCPDWHDHDVSSLGSFWLLIFLASCLNSGPCHPIETEGGPYLKKRPDGLLLQLFCIDQNL